jgi:histidinol-phosphate aminotransferase
VKSRSFQATTSVRRIPSLDGPIRLDLLPNAYGPSIRVQEALASAADLHLSQAARTERVRERLAALVGVPPNWLVLANGADEVLQMTLLWGRKRGAFVSFPPTESEGERLAKLFSYDLSTVPRSGRYMLDLDSDRVQRVPRHSIAYVMSPNDPTGTVLSPVDAVRLSRRANLVVADERHGGYSGQTILPLTREFDNLVVVQSLETWAALAGFPLAYAIAPPRLAAQLAECRPSRAIAAGSLIAAEATLDDLAYVRATVDRVREEKSRLFRTLRKLNMLSPVPSWANFLLGHVKRGSAAEISRELARRDIRVYRPPQPELEDYLRITATRPEQTDALKRALVDIAVEL